MTNLFEPNLNIEIATPEAIKDLLRFYQRDVLNRARRNVGKGLRRGVIQGATGAGKTYIMAENARLALEKGKRCLILADRRKLIKQIAKTLDVFKVPYGIIMSGDTRATHQPVILASRDTLASWVKNELDLPDPFDLIEVDECHKSLNDVYQWLLKLWQNAVVIGYTATPARGDGRALSDFYQWLECTVPTSQLVAEGWLIKPEVYVPLELARARKEGKKIKGLAGNPVEHWLEHANGLPTIAFASKVSESTALRDRFIEAGISAEHIDADTPDDDSPQGRDAVYKRLANGETKIVCSVGLCIEGLDVPEVACAILWAKFGSIIQLLQGVGRIMRPAPWAGKTRAVLLDHAGACGEHGLPGEDIEWSLDSNSSVKQRRKKAIKDGRLENPTICQQCGCMYQDKSCPSCGWKAPRRKTFAPAQEALQARDEVLARYEGEASSGSREQESRQRAWMRCIGIAIGKGAKAGMAVGIFKSQFGIPPWQAGVEPMPTDWKAPAKEAFPNYGRSKAS